MKNALGGTPRGSERGVVRTDGTTPTQEKLRSRNHEKRETHERKKRKRELEPRNRRNTRKKSGIETGRNRDGPSFLASNFVRIFRFLSVCSVYSVVPFFRSNVFALNAVALKIAFDFSTFSSKGLTAWECFPRRSPRPSQSLWACHSEPCPPECLHTLRTLGSRHLGLFAVGFEHGAKCATREERLGVSPPCSLER